MSSTLKDKPSTSKEKLSTSKEKPSISKEKKFISKEKPSTPKEKSFTSKEISNICHHDSKQAKDFEILLITPDDIDTSSINIASGKVIISKNIMI